MTPAVQDPDYRTKVYNALKGELGDSFDKSIEDFNNLLDSDPEYAPKVYNALKGELGDSFDKTPEDFNTLISLKKKDETTVSQEPVEEPTEPAPTSLPEEEDLESLSKVETKPTEPEKVFSKVRERKFIKTAPDRGAVAEGTADITVEDKINEFDETFTYVSDDKPQRPDWFYLDADPSSQYSILEKPQLHKGETLPPMSADVDLVAGQDEWGQPEGTDQDINEAWQTRRNKAVDAVNLVLQPLAEEYFKDWEEFWKIDPNKVKSQIDSSIESLGLSDMEEEDAKELAYDEFKKRAHSNMDGMVGDMATEKVESKLEEVYGENWKDIRNRTLFESGFNPDRISVENTGKTDEATQYVKNKLNPGTAGLKWVHGSPHKNTPIRNLSRKQIEHYYNKGQIFIDDRESSEKDWFGLGVSGKAWELYKGHRESDLVPEEGKKYQDHYIKQWGEEYASKMDDRARSFLSDEEKSISTAVDMLNQYAQRPDADPKKIKMYQEMISRRKDSRTTIYDPATQSYVNKKDASDEAKLAWGIISENALKLKGENAVEDLKKMRDRAYFELEFLKDRWSDNYKKNYSHNLNDEEMKKTYRPQKITQKDGLLYEKDLYFQSLNRALMLNESPAGLERSWFTPFLEALGEGFGGDFRTAGDFAEGYANAVMQYGGHLSDKEKDRAIKTGYEKVTSAIGGSIPAMVQIALVGMITEGAGVPAVVESMFAGLKASTKSRSVGIMLDLLEAGAKREITYELAGQGPGTGLGEGVGAGVYDITGIDKLIAKSKVGGKIGSIFSTVFRQFSRASGETIEEYTGQFFNELANDKDFGEAFAATIGDDPLEKLAITYTVAQTMSASALRTDFKLAKTAMEQKLLEYEGDNQIINEAKQTAIEDGKIRVGVTAATDKLADVGELMTRATNLTKQKDFKGAEEVHNEVLDIGEEVIKNKTGHLDKVEINLDRTKGNFFGYTEPTFDGELISEDETQLKEAQLRMVEAAEEMKQDAIHFSEMHTDLPEGVQFGEKQEDGGVFEPNIVVRFSEPLTDEQYEALSEQLGSEELAGSTLTPDRTGIEMYNISNFEEHGKFIEKAKSLSGTLQSAGVQHSIEEGVRKLWNIGIEGSGATQSYAEFKAQSEAGSKPTEEKIEEVKPTVLDKYKDVSLLDKTPDDLRKMGLTEEEIAEVEVLKKEAPIEPVVEEPTVKETEVEIETETKPKTVDDFMTEADARLEESPQQESPKARVGTPIKVAEGLSVRKWGDGTYSITRPDKRTISGDYTIYELTEEQAKKTLERWKDRIEGEAEPKAKVSDSVKKMASIDKQLAKLIEREKKAEQELSRTGKTGVYESKIEKIQKKQAELDAKETELAKGLTQEQREQWEELTGIDWSGHFGEDIPLPKEKVDPEVEPVKEAAPEAPKYEGSVFDSKEYEGDYLVKEGADLQVYRDGKKVVRSKRKKKIVEEYKQANVRNFTRGKRADTAYEPGKGPSTPKEYAEDVLENSENPLEVAQAWSNIRSEEVADESIDSIIADNLGKVTSDSYYRNGDRNKIKGTGAALNYFAKKGEGGEPIDIAARRILEEGMMLDPDTYSDVKESEMIQNIVEFIEAHPGGTRAYVRPPLMSESLGAKFKDLTGFDIDENYYDQLTDNAIDEQFEAYPEDVLMSLEEEQKNSKDAEEYYYNKLLEYEREKAGLTEGETKIGPREPKILTGGAIREGGDGVRTVATQEQSEAASQKIIGQSKDYVQQNKEKFNIPDSADPVPVSVDPTAAKSQGESYEGMESTVDSPETIAAYEALGKEVDAQYNYLVNTLGVNIEFIEGDPYTSSKEMAADIENNNTLKVFKGGEDHPLLGSTTADADGLTLNEKFRAVHDYFGHASEGNQFGPVGEERAWVAHSRMFSPEAQRALTTETRGQNSWVNFGPHMWNESGWKGDKSNPEYIAPKDRPYAEQKVGLLPEEVADWQGTIESSKEAYEADGVEIQEPKSKEESIKEIQEAFKTGGKSISVEQARLLLNEGFTANNYDAKLAQQLEAIKKAFNDGNNNLNSGLPINFKALKEIGKYIRIWTMKHGSNFRKFLKAVGQKPVRWIKDLFNYIAVKSVNIVRTKKGYDKLLTSKQKRERGIKGLTTVNSLEIYNEYVEDLQGKETVAELRDAIAELIIINDIQASQTTSKAALENLAAAREALIHLNGDIRGKKIEEANEILNQEIKEVNEESKKDWTLHEETLGEWVRRKVADVKDPIKVIQDSIEAHKGAKIKPEDDVFTLMDLEAGKVKANTDELLEWVAGKRTGIAGSKKSKKESFVSRLKKAGVSIADLGKYMVARHVPERNERLVAIREAAYAENLAKLQKDLENGTLNELEYQAEVDAATELHKEALKSANTGMSDSDAITIQFNLEDKLGREKLEAFAAEYTEKILHAKIDILESGGVINAETAEKMRNGRGEGVDFLYYVPMKVQKSVIDEIREATGDYGVMSASSQPLKGLDATAKSANFKAFERNNPIYQGLYDIFEAHRMVEQNNSRKALKKLIEENPDPKVWNVVTPYSKNLRVTGGSKSEFVPVTTINKKGDAVTNYIEIKDPRLVAIFKKQADKGKFLKAIQKAWDGFNNLSRSLYTTYNVSFGFPNLTRDLQDVMFNLTAEETKGMRWRVLKNLPSSMWGVLTSEKGYKTKNAMEYEEMISEGGQVSWMDLNDVEKTVDAINKEIKDVKNRNPLKSITRGLLMFNTIMEQGTRFAVYKSAKDVGLSKQDAASLSKNVTINFSRKGEWGSMFNRIWLFSNAGVQGLDKTIKVTTGKGGRRIAALLTGLGYAQAALMYAVMGDDEEERDYILTKYDVQNNFIFPLGGGLAITIPKPYSGAKVFANAGYYMYEAQETGRPWEAVTNIMEDVTGQIDIVGGGADNLVSKYTPEPLKPVFEIYNNQNYMGKPIVPEKPFGKPQRDVEKMYKDTEGSAYQMVADFARDNIGLDASPETYKHLFKGYVWKGALTDVDKMYNVVDKSLKGEKLNHKEIPIWKRFVKDFGEDSWRAYAVTKQMWEDSPNTEFTKKEMKKYFDLLDKQAEGGHSVTRMYRDFIFNQERVYKENGKLSEFNRIIDSLL